MNQPFEQHLSSTPIHDWFGLSYAQYLTLPRSIMEAMPHAWQAQMAALLAELDHTYDWRPREGRYWCRLKNAQGRFVADPLQEYRRPDLEYIAQLRHSPLHALSVMADITDDGLCSACGTGIDLDDLAFYDFQVHDAISSPGTPDCPPVYYAEGTIGCPDCGVRLWVQVSS